MLIHPFEHVDEPLTRNVIAEEDDKEDEGVHSGTNKEIHVRIPRLIINTA